MERRELFGGAIVMGVPRRFADVSGIRQVPDTQEVFVCQETDQSVIVEVLELSEEADVAHAAQFHFNVLAEDNSSSQSSIETESIVQEVTEG